MDVLTRALDELDELKVVYGDSGLFVGLAIARDSLADNYALDMRERVMA